jgi:hypothetical protein
VFVSDDGTSWSFHSIDDAQEASLQSIAAGNAGYLITGQASLGDASAPAVTWFSPDALTWTRASAPNVEELVSVVPYGNGFIALGSQRDEVTYQRTTYSMWQTIDGSTWEPLGAFPEQLCCSPMAIAAQELLAVAVGAGDCEDALIGAAWRYVPGSATWDRVQHSHALDTSFLWHVAATDDGFLSVGTRGREFDASKVGIWTSADGSDWQLRRLLTDEGNWIAYGPAIGPGGLLVLAWSSGMPDFLASPMPSPPPRELVTWLLPPGGSPGDGVPDDGAAASSGCNAPRRGTGLSSDYLEGWMSVSVPISFKSVEIGGQPARRGANASGTVEVLLIGDSTDIQRIEVRGRDTAFEGGAGVFALEWLWTGYDSVQEAMWEIQDGTRQHMYAVVGDLAVTGNRLSGVWQYQFTVTLAHH